MIRVPEEFRRPLPPLLRGAITCTLAVVVATVVVATATGCSSSNKGGGGRSAGRADNAKPLSNLTGTELRAEAMASADIYVTTIVQALDQLREQTKRPDVARWALYQKIATATAAFTNASQASDGGSLLDMLVLSTLKRHAVEEQWIPNLLHDEGKVLLDAQVRAEADVWTAGEKALTKKQLAELKVLIEEWRREHPTQYYVSHVRLADIATSRNLSRQSPQVKLPGSVFGLLYLDPLSGLDPVAAELHSYRALTERMMYLAQRMPAVIAAQVDYAALNATSTPQVLRVVDGIDKFNATVSRFTDVTSRFTDATSRFADTTAKYPQHLTSERKAAIDQAGATVATERKAAIDQAAAAVAAERKAVLAELESQESRVRRIMDDAKSVLDRADTAGASINKSTTQTVATAEQSTRRTIDHLFWRTLVLILVLLAGIPISAIVYRKVAARDAERRRSVHSAG